MQILYELLENGVPVDYLFYDSYIETEDIYEQIILKGLNRWLMSANTLSDLNVIGINMKYMSAPNLLTIYPDIEQIFAKGNKLFIWVNTDCLPHLSHILGGIHAIRLDSYDKDKGLFTITDIPVLERYIYDEKAIQSAFDSLPSDLKYITFLSYKNYSLTETTAKQLINKFEVSFLNINEDLFLYDKIIDLLLNLPSNLEEKKALFNRFENVFSVVSGSRYFLSKFFGVTRYLSTDQLNKIIELSSNIQYVFLKAIIQGELDNETIIMKIKQLKKLEAENIRLIKNSIISNQNKPITFTISPNQPIDIKLKCRDMIDNRVILEWEDVLKEHYVLNYEIYLNNTLLDATLQNSYEIQNSPYNCELDIQIKVKTFGDYMNLINNTIKVDPIPSQKDYAKGKPVYCSSQESSIFKKENINDGDPSTRWGSKEGNDLEWIYIDLLEEVNIKRIVLHWEDASAKSYTIDVSNDSLDWSTLIQNDLGRGGVEYYDDFEPIKCRFIKMNGLKRSTRWGYSLWRFEVYSE